MKRIIHNKGPKAERDRVLLVKFYDSVCRAFPWYQPVDISSMTNTKLKALCEKVWTDQTPEDQVTYMKVLKTQPEIVVEAPKQVKYRNLIVPQELAAENV